jgi:hypothetical protein
MAALCSPFDLIDVCFVGEDTGVVWVGMNIRTRSSHASCKSDGNVRWRHVGIHEGKCILYNLAELEESASNHFVTQHVEEFMRRAKINSLGRVRHFSSIEKTKSCDVSG